MALECRRLLEVGQPEAAAAQPQASTSSQVVALTRKQPNIADAIHQQAEDAYRKLLMWWCHLGNNTETSGATCEGKLNLKPQVAPPVCKFITKK